MSDKLVFDLSQEVDGSPNVFVNKSWLNILDNMNGNYSGNQSVIDTSQLSNSNKWMSYREAYLYIPMLLNLSPITAATTNDFSVTGKSADYALGLKNWFGSIIHSFTLDYNGTTIIQQTPFCNMWNSFKLLTSLSQGDVDTLGATIGFFPDNPLSWSYTVAANGGPNGKGVTNNTNYVGITVVSGAFNNFQANNGNDGFLKRQQYINYDPSAPIVSGVGTTYTAFLTAVNSQALWKSHISQKTEDMLGVSVSAVVHLKHLHSFFQFTPLLKGVYMKMTMTLNNSSTNLTVIGTADAGSLPTAITATSVNVPSGGINTLMISSTAANNGGRNLGGVTTTIDPATYIGAVSVGNKCLNTTLKSVAAPNAVTDGSVGANIYLYVPAYTFNPIFEQAYLSSPVKSIKYTDIYQYQFNISDRQTFNQLITNGIANIKSVLIVPFHTSTATGLGVPAYQSPFDPAGAGPTSPLCHFTNFNVVISGQNAIYNTQRYAFEEWNNQLYGTNAVNGGEIDGLTSGLIGQLGWEMEYCYYYVNVSRMLPVEEAVPKSVQILGTSTSPFALELMVFVEYGVSVDIDILSGSRV
jgi:hypothetical protein